MKLIKFNKTKTDCGVVAALNAAQWSGLRCTYDKAMKLALASGYSPEHGVYAFQFSNLLMKLNVPFRKISPKSPECMLKRLKNGSMLAVLYVPTTHNVGHALSCLVDYEGKAFIVNPERKRSSGRRTWITLMRDIKTNGMKEFHVYEIPRKQRIKLATGNDESRTA